MTLQMYQMAAGVMDGEILVAQEKWATKIILYSAGILKHVI